MLKSRKFIVWLTSLVVFLMIIALELFLNRNSLFISELGISISLISSIYMSSNVYQKKVLKEKEE